MHTLPRHAALAAFCLVILAYVTPGSAKEQLLLEHQGNWQAYRVRDHKGQDLCAIVQFADQLGFMIKFDGKQAFMHLSDRRWSVPEKRTMSVAFNVDGQALGAVSFHGTSEPALIEAIFDITTAATLLERFAHGRDMTVSFPDGDSTPWHLSLGGTSKIVDSFVGCSSAMMGGSGQPSGAGAAHTPPPPPPPQGQPFRTGPLPDAGGKNEI